MAGSLLSKNAGSFASDYQSTRFRNRSREIGSARLCQRHLIDVVKILVEDLRKPFLLYRPLLAQQPGKPAC